MENIQLEIRSHMEDAKHEITILQRQYEQRMLKKSVKLGLTGSNKGSSIFGVAQVSENGEPIYDDNRERELL